MGDSSKAVLGKAGSKLAASACSSRKAASRGKQPLQAWMKAAYRQAASNVAVAACLRGGHLRGSLRNLRHPFSTLAAAGASRQASSKLVVAATPSKQPLKQQSFIEWYFFVSAQPESAPRFSTRTEASRFPGGGRVFSDGFSVRFSRLGTTRASRVLAASSHKFALGGAKHAALVT